MNRPGVDKVQVSSDPAEHAGVGSLAGRYAFTNLQLRTASKWKQWWSLSVLTEAGCSDQHKVVVPPVHHQWAAAVPLAGRLHPQRPFERANHLVRDGKWGVLHTEVLPAD